MGSRDRPHREVKKKAKPTDPKPTLSPYLDPPQSVEIIKPKRKPRTVDEADES